MELAVYQYVLVGMLFIWSGIVRSGFGFGGAIFVLPFLLLIDNQPLVYLPIIAVHVLIFSSLTIYRNHVKQKKLTVDGEGGVGSTVDWTFLKRALTIMIIPKMIGVFGLLTLPPKIMGIVIFVIVTFYALTYVLNKPFRSKSKTLDVSFLMLGGYISGTSLIGGPLIVAIFSKHVARVQLRDTLFALWFILVTIKMSSFIYFGVDLQLIHHLWLLPCAFVGHFVGLKLHDYLLSTDTVRFYRIFGCVLLITNMVGIAKIL